MFEFAHSKNCYFFQYFVGNSDTLSVQITCLSAYMHVLTKFPKYRQNSESISLTVIVALILKYIT